uniref:Secreted peptide n=1 Tax=Panagrellus redivivus TaxID=6233 RepID=A0A7E4VBV5_PANRE
MAVRFRGNGWLCCLLILASILTTIDGLNAVKCYPKSRIPFRFAISECAVPLVIVGGYFCLGAILIVSTIMAVSCCAQCSCCFDQRVPDNWVG